MSALEEAGGWAAGRDAEADGEAGVGPRAVAEDDFFAGAEGVDEVAFGVAEAEFAGSGADVVRVGEAIPGAEVGADVFGEGSVRTCAVGLAGGGGQREAGGDGGGRRSGCGPRVR